MSVSEKKLISQREYVRNHGKLCPQCRSKDIQALVLVDGDLSQKCYCVACRAKWVEEYTITGYSDFKGEE